MAETIDNISVTADAWVDLNTAAGISVGTAFDITNEKGGVVLLYESDTEPDETETSGRKLNTFASCNNVAEIESGSLTIWAKTQSNGSITGSELNVQES